jgi:predicted permease
MMERTVAYRGARALVRLAARRVPMPDRSRFVREWDGELADEAARGGGWRVVVAAWGAFADAKTVRALGRAETRAAGSREHVYGRGSAMGWIRGWRNDVTVALRSMLRAPGFTTVAVLTLALGIGGSAAIWNVLDRVVLDPLPYPGPERLLRLENQVPGVGPDEVWRLSTAQWVYFTDHAETLDEVGLYRGTGGTVVTSSGAERIRSVEVTASMMGLLGARAELGRVIGADDDRPDAEPVALISHAFWQRALGGDPDVVGRSLRYNDRPVEVVGVLEDGLDPPGWPAELRPDLWLPLQIDRNGQFWNNHAYDGIARLAPGATAASVQAEMAGLTAQLPAAFPRAYSPGFFDQYGFRTQVVPLKAWVVGNLARNLWILFGGVILVLLIAAANVANLFLVRMEARRREVAVRAALGAGRSVLARYVLAEGMTLALVGAAVALVVCYWAVPALISLAPSGLPRIQGAGMDLGTVAFTLAISILVGLGLAAYPMLAHAAPDTAAELASGGRASSSGAGARRLRGVLVAAQVALALTLMVGAGLLVETLAKLRQADPGVDAEGVLAVELVLSYQRYGNDVAVWNLYRSVLDQVRALPGVTGAGMSEEIPVSGGYGCTIQGFEDATVYQRIEDAGLTTCAGQEATTPGYFETMHIPVLEGRTFTEGDNTVPGGGVAVVSRAFAERFWPGQEAIGQGVAPSGRTVGPFYRVVGVVDDVARSTAGGEIPLSKPAMAVYYPIRKHSGETGSWNWWPGHITLVVRTDRADPTSLVPEVRRVVAALDPEIPLANATSMSEIVAAAFAQISFVSLLIGIAAAVALLLAAVGLYGVISYVVARRTREIGMRMAVGAQPGEVQRMVVRESILVVAGGLVVGVGLALATTRVLEGLLVGVAHTDPVVYTAAAVALAVIALFASWLPARRASRIDPLEALRAE